MSCALRIVRHPLALHLQELLIKRVVRLGFERQLGMAQARQFAGVGRRHGADQLRDLPALRLARLHDAPPTADEHDADQHPDEAGQPGALARCAPESMPSRRKRRRERRRRPRSRNSEREKSAWCGKEKAAFLQDRDDFHGDCPVTVRRHFSNQRRISLRRPIAGRILDLALQAVREVDRVEAEARRVGAPLVVVEERPVQVADERHAVAARSSPPHARAAAGTGCASSGRAAAPRLVAIRAAAQRHAIFRDEHRAAEILRVVFAEKMQPAREHAPVPPFARHRGEHPGAEGAILELVIPEHRQAEGVRGEGIVVVEPDVIEQAACAADA